MNVPLNNPTANTMFDSRWRPSPNTAAVSRCTDTILGKELKVIQSFGMGS